MNSLEIADKKAQLKIRAKEMTDLCRAEIRMFTEEEQTEFNSIINEIKQLNNEKEQIERSLNIEDDKIDNIDKETNTRKVMEKRFSLVNAIKTIANNQNLDEVTASVINAGKDEMRKAGLSMGGQIQLPLSELRAGEPAYSVTVEGEDIVPTDLYNPLEPLRAKNVLVQAGAKFLTGLVGNVQIPVMSATNCDWELEAASAKDGSGSFTAKTLSPKRLTCYVDITKQLIAQDAIGVENMIRQDIVNAINSKLEATILGAGDGKNTDGDVIAPVGLFNGKELGVVDDLEKIAELEAGVEEANILGECKYLISPKAKAGFRPKAKGEKITESLYQNGEIDGTPAISTGHITGYNFVYGDFSCLAIGQWGSVDIVVDPYSQAVNGKIRLVVNTFFDAVVLRDAAFAFGKTKA